MINPTEAPATLPRAERWMTNFVRSLANPTEVLTTIFNGHAAFNAAFNAAKTHSGRVAAVAMVLNKITEFEGRAAAITIVDQLWPTFVVATVDAAAA